MGKDIADRECISLLQIEMISEGALHVQAIRVRSNLTSKQKFEKEYRRINKAKISDSANVHPFDKYFVDLDGKYRPRDNYDPSYIKQIEDERGPTKKHREY